MRRGPITVLGKNVVPGIACYRPEVVDRLRTNIRARGQRDTARILGPDRVAGCDQLVFGTGWQSKESTLEMIRLMGEHVIPELDGDPVHRTTRFREHVASGS